MPDPGQHGTRLVAFLALATALFCGSSAGAAPLFRSTCTICLLPGNRSARQPGLADLDGDGRVDVISGSSDGLCTFFQQADRTFGTPVVSGAGRVVGVLAVAAMNSDFAPDVVALQTSSGQPDQILVFLDSSGILTLSPVTVVLPSIHAKPAVADLNGDGRADMVTTDYNASQVLIYLNDGAGGLLPATIRPSAYANPTSVFITDFNFDGIPDLYVAGSGGAEVDYGLGGGVFDAPVLVANPAAANPAWLGSFDGTPWPDAIVSIGPLEFRSSSGPGVFGPSSTIDGSIPAPIVDLSAGDFAGDAAQDLVILDGSFLQEARPYIGHGNGSFTAAPDFVVGAGPKGVAIADVNGDGIRDLAVGGQGSGYTSVHFSNGDGTVGTPSLLLNPAPSDIALADIDGDGLPDAVTVTVALGDNSLRVFHGNGDGSFGTQTRIDLGGSGRYLTVASVNGDVLPDVLVPVTSGSVKVLLNGGSGALLAPTSVAVTGQPRSLAVGDLDHDGHLDCAVPAFDSGTTTILLGDGAGGFAAAPAVVAASGLATNAAIARFGTDANPDLAVSNGSQVLVYAGNGDGTFQPSPTVLATPVSATALVAADADGDGAMDLFAMPASGLDLFYWHNDGAGGFDPRASIATRSEPNASLNTSPIPSHMIVRDFDGDGSEDLLIVNNQRLCVLIRGTTPGSFGTPLMLGAGQYSAGLAAADLDSDGDLDAVVIGVASTSAAHGSISTLLNQRNLVGIPPGAGSPRVGLALAAPYPNPTRGAFGLHYRLPVAGPVRVDLVDVSGRRVESFSGLPSGAGEQGFHLTPTVNLRPGVYSVILTQGSRRAVTKVVVLD